MGVIEARRRILLTTPHAVTTTPAPVASFDTDMVGKLRSAKFAFLPVQSGSGDPSPTNVRPISGWDGVTAYWTGKNLFDYTNADIISGIRDRSGNHTADSYSGYTNNPTRVKPSTAYTISGDLLRASGYAVRIYYLDANKGWISRTDAYSTNVVKITTPNNCYYIQIQTKLTGTNPDTWQVEQGSEQTAYQSFGSTYPVTWQSAGTIYGGYVDLCKGVVVAEWVSCSFEGDVCSALWYDTDSGRDTLSFYREARVWSITDYPTPVDGGGIFDYCKVGTVYNENTPWVARFLFMNGSFNRFEMRLPKSVLADITSESAAKQSVVSYLDAHPLQAVYKISPITYAITPTIIKSLKGTNNLWSNANGDAEATYWTHRGGGN